MTRGKNLRHEPSGDEGSAESAAAVRSSRAGFGVGGDFLPGFATDLRWQLSQKLGREVRQSDLEAFIRRLEFAEDGDTSNPETSEELSQWLSDRKFYDQNLRESLEATHPGANLFALYFPASSIIREDPGPERGEARVFATGEALISIPARTRRGAMTVADLTVPVRVRGHTQDGRFVFDGADFVPKSAYFPPLVPDRVSRPRRAARQ